VWTDIWVDPWVSLSSSLPLSLSLIRHLSETRLASVAWKHLHDLYQKKDLSSRFNLKQKLFNYKYNAVELYVKCLCHWFVALVLHCFLWFPAASMCLVLCDCLWLVCPSRSESCSWPWYNPTVTGVTSRS
jgi:hypothetical protein